MNTRQTTKRDLGRMADNVDWILYKLKEMSDAYTPTHPQIGEQFDTLAAYFILGQEAVNSLNKSL